MLGQFPLCTSTYEDPESFVRGVQSRDIVLFFQGSHRLEKYLNIQDCFEKSLKIRFVLKST